MIELPIWAQAKEPRDILQTILAERPDATAPKSDWGERVVTYHGPNAERLRRFYAKLQDEALAGQDAGEGTPFADLYEQERPDELIDRLLNEQPAKVVLPFTRMVWKDRADGSSEIAA